MDERDGKEESEDECKEEAELEGGIVEVLEDACMVARVAKSEE